ncbi:apolipoprotein N-acyltransferase [Pararhizobium sp.]|uniref:apolipoprotein N-acyltransferase n=1 Tax=Pararhizobium sp. TaxID=1977563 RepID=UPI002715A470|nr:apolipoprotein N-acyltransferase [Pararhizobium sp.]MDO9417742.1 apolipoprotein N-acyltransferase [Pararhizobium sp.]
MQRLAGRIMLLWGWKRGLTAFLAGLVSVLALAPFGIFAACFISFPVLVWLLDGASGNPDAGRLRRLLPAFFIGWWFGFGYFLGGLWWIGNALLVEAEDFAWALPLAVVGLPAGLAIFYGIATALARALWSDGVGRIFALAAAFGLVEWARSFVFTGFPWNAIGYTAMPVPLMMQSDRVMGMDAMSMLAVFVFAAPALLGTIKGARIGLTLAGLVAAAHFGYGAYSLYIEKPPIDPSQQTLVRLVQPAIDQSQKLDNSSRLSVFEAHLAMTAAVPAEGGKRPDVIVWPETAVPFILTENPDALLRIADVLQDGQVLLAGAVRTEESGTEQEPRYYNSIYAIDDKGQIITAADKVHLVPFGEYMPFQSLLRSWGVDPVAMPGGYSAASVHNPLALPQGRSFYPLICYEAIFPHEIESAAAGTDALLNITNDAWFGNSPGPYQHFQQARLRAVESGLPMIRVANNGITAMIDARGQIVEGLGYDAKGYFDATLPGKMPLDHGNSSRNLIYTILASLGFLVALISRSGFISRDN